MAEGLVGGDEARAAGRLIEQLGTILKGVRDDMPDGFAAALLGRAAPEDLLAYEPRELASLAEDAWAFLMVRPAGAPKIRVESRAGPMGAERVKAVTVIEIVNDDMPFLLDSVMGELTEQGLTVRLVVHPILAIDREADGALSAFRGLAGGDGRASRESFIHIHVDRIDNVTREAEIAEAIAQVLADVRICVTDWPAILARVNETVAELRANPPPLPADEIAEAVQFLEWLTTDNFTFLGVRSYRYAGVGEIDPQFETGLGILRGAAVRVLRRGSELVSITPEVMEFLNEPKALIITKANVRSRVHRRIHMDYIGVKQFDADGTLIGELRIVGLFTSTAYTRSARQIPYLRRKIDAVLAPRRLRAGQPFRQGAGQRPGDLSARRIVPDRRRYAARLRPDGDAARRTAARAGAGAPRPLRPLRLGPRLRAARPLRQRRPRSHRQLSGGNLSRPGLGLLSVLPGRAAGPRALHHRPLRRRDAEPGPRDPRARGRRHRAHLDGRPERRARDRSRSGQGAGVAGALPRRVLGRLSRGLFARRRGRATSASSRPCRRCARSPSTSTARREVRRYRAGLKVWNCDSPIPLSERVPVLENMGFRVVDERTYRIAAAGPPEACVWLHDMMLERADGAAIDLDALEQRLEAAFMMVMRGRAENDGFNALVLAAGLPWRDVALVRTIARYLRQARIAVLARTTCGRRCASMPPSPPTSWRCSMRGSIRGRTARRTSVRACRRHRRTHRSCAAGRRQPRRGPHPAPLRQRGRRGLAHQFLSGRRDGAGEPTIAIKFDSRRIDGLPLPRPLYEIFVYSPRVEGVHLRFGKVARGGLRWSDRPQDFRTEVLGLVKAQQVKNAVIVPVGAKGGFVPKQLPVGGPREAFQAEGIAAYTIFVVQPARRHRQYRARRRHRPPHMPCATTATIPISWSPPTRAPRPSPTSPTASRAEHGFWLGDAFASGGSAGYDHKKMGITARGAWEAVKRHFREMDVDIQTTPFTRRRRRRHVGRRVRQRHAAVARTIRLVAAFDHRDIFIDPDPDPEAQLRRAPAAVRAAALELAGLRQAPDLARAAACSRAPPRRSRSRPKPQALLGLAGAAGDAARR